MHPLPEMPPYRDTCYCTVCARFFNSEAAFDKHRTGDLASVGKPSTRRCMTEAEMRAAGMGVNEAGRWVTRLWDAGAQARLEEAS